MPKLKTLVVTPPTPPTAQFADGLHVALPTPKTFFFSRMREGRRLKRQLLIGRDTQCDIHLTRDRGVSREHAVLQYVKGQGRVIIDQGSTNGIYINGDRLDGLATVTVGMRIIVGKTLLIGVDREGSFPIPVVEITELARLAAQQYGNCRIAGEHIGRSKEFVRVRTLPERGKRTKRSRRPG